MRLQISSQKATDVEALPGLTDFISRSLRACIVHQIGPCLLLLGLSLVTDFRAICNAAPTPQKEANTASASPTTTKDKKEFELRIVGPDGKPVPEALVDFRMDPSPTAEQVHRGKFVKKSTYGTSAKADAEGTLIIELPPTASSYFDVNITVPGYGPYWASWTSANHQEAIPPRFTAELEAGWSVGGVIVDEEGKPIPGAKVQPHIEYKKRPGDLRQLGSGATMTTDAAGKWHYDSVPASMGMVYASIDHPDFKPIQPPLSRGEFGIKAGQDQGGKIVLSRGLTVVGKVTDEAGKPIVGALIRTKFVNDIREARTGNDGTYRLVGCDARSARVVVSAKGRATDMKELAIEPEMAPVDFQMKPGGTVRVRVLDDKGNPAPKARIFFQRWRGNFQYFEFNHVTQYTGQDGTWVWTDAPLDEFSADICPPDNNGMQLVRQPLIARAEEYVFRLPAPLIVTGKVVDAVTKEPIKEFRVVPGSRFSPTQMYWSQNEAFNVTNGRFEVREDRVEESLLIRIESDGYEAAISRDIKNTEGSVTVDFELKRGKNILAKVVTPSLQPAKGAVVALGIAGSQIMIKNGEIENHSTRSERTTADENGRFHFTAQDKDFLLIITHPTGYAQIKASPGWETMKIIRLEPWAKVEGTYKIGPKPAPDVPLALYISGRESQIPRGTNLFVNHSAMTGPDGKFVFERVIPGIGSISREINFNQDQGADQITSSFQIMADLPGGKTTHLDLGGTGRPVIGKLQLPENADKKLRWNFALVRVIPEATEPPARIRSFSATVERDGSFRIDDVPDGNYELDVQFMQGFNPAFRSQRITVSSPAAGSDPKPVELGTLKLGLPAN